jgi:hypothetical protein
LIARPPELPVVNPFEQVDPVLGPWADENGIRLFPVYKDWEVRSFDCVNGDYQIWIDPPPADGTIAVHVWRRDNRGTVTFADGVTELRNNLDRALELAAARHATGDPTRLPPSWIRRLVSWLRLDRG